MLKLDGVELLNICNLSCPNCYTPGTKYPRGMANDHVVYEAMKYGTPREYFSVYGSGEPFLHPKLYEYIQAAKDRGYLPYISTNGLLLTEDSLGRSLEAGVKLLQISVHTLKSLEALKLAAHQCNHQEVTLQANVLTYYIESGQLERWCAECGITPEERAFFRVIGTHNWAGNGADGKVVYPQEDIVRRKANCVYLRHGLCYVKWDGLVVSCCFDSEGDNVIGHIDDFPNLQHLPHSYPLCRFCGPNWTNGEMI